MNTLAQNIERYISFDSNLRDLVKNEGVAIPDNTSCEDLLGIVEDVFEAGGRARIYGVSGFYGSSPSLTRTDDSVGLGFTIDAATGSIESDFNNVFPWNKTGVVTLEQGKFLRFPEMFFRVGCDSEHRLTDVAVSSQPHSEGNWFRVAPFYYACYGASLEGSALASRSGVERVSNKTRTALRTAAASSGEGFTQLDLYHRNVLMFLWFIEFATKKSDDIMTGRISGSGTQGGSTPRFTGGTDSVASPSGFETEYGQMRYHYIEDFIGNFGEFVDGVYCSPQGTADFVTADPSEYSDTSAGKAQVSYPSPESGCLAALGWEDERPFLCMPHSVVQNGNYNTYFCDQTYNSANSTSALFCGPFYSNAQISRGLTFYAHYNAGFTSESIGGRLICVI